MTEKRQVEWICYECGSKGSSTHPAEESYSSGIIAAALHRSVAPDCSAKKVHVQERVNGRWESR